MKNTYPDYSAQLADIWPSRSKVKRALTFFLLLSVGQVFCYKFLIGSLKSDVTALKNDLEVHNAYIAKALERDLSNDDTQLIDQPAKSKPPTIPIRLDTKSIQEFQLEEVKTMKVEVVSSTEEIKQPTEPDDYYYILAINQKPVKSATELRYDKARVHTDDEHASDYHPNGVVITTASNKTIRTNHLPVNNEAANGKGTWRIVLSEDKGLDSEITTFIKKYLKKRGYSVSNRKIWDAQDALHSYQSDNNLPVGNINFETLDRLGIKLYMCKKQ